MSKQTKKNLASYIAASALICIVNYLLFSFVIAELNPFTWSADARFFLAFATVLSIVAYVFIRAILESNPCH